MLGKVFYVNITEITQTGMQCDISKINAFNFHPFHQFTAKMQAGSRRRYSSFVLCKDRLETYRIFFFYRTINDRVGQWSFTQRIECFLKFVMGTIIEETQCTPTWSGIIDYFSHHWIIVTKIKFIADTDFTCRIYQYIPQTKFFIQLTQ